MIRVEPRTVREIRPPGLAASSLACLDGRMRLCAGCAVLRAAGDRGRLAARGRGRSGGDRRPRAGRGRSIGRSRHARSRRRLTANDPILPRASSNLPRPRVELPPSVRQRVEAAVTEANSASLATRSNFARGLITGEPDDVVSLAGTALGDLFVFGDIRDAVREGSRYAPGRDVRRTGARARLRRHRGHRRHLCVASARRAGARRAVGGEGRAQDRQARRADGRTGSGARCARSIDWSALRKAPASRWPSRRSRCARRARRSRSRRPAG